MKLAILACMLGVCALSACAPTFSQLGRDVAIGAINGARKSIGLNFQRADDQRLGMIAHYCALADAVVTVHRPDMPVLEEEGKAFCKAVFAEVFRRQALDQTL